MKVENGKIVEIAENELFQLYLNREVDVIDVVAFILCHNCCLQIIYWVIYSL